MTKRATRWIFASALCAILGCGGTGSSTGNPTDGGTDHALIGHAGHKDAGRDVTSRGDAGSPDDGGADTSKPDGGADTGADVGDGGSDVADSAPLPTEWTIVSTPLDGGVDLFGVGGNTTIDVWAVGGTPTAPADIFWAGTVWTNLGLVTSASPLLSVSSTMADDSWTVAGSTIFHWDGTGWHTLAKESNTTPLARVFAAAPGRAFAVGNAGTVLDCDDATTVCTSVTAGTSDLTSVWGLDATMAWAVGKGGVVFAFDGTSWTAQTGSGTSDLFAVEGSDDVDLWAVGDVILHSDGSGTWTKDPFAPTGTLRGVWAAAPDQAWAVGKGGVILAWDGKKWKSTTSPTTSDLYAIWAWDVHDIWAVGANNTVLRRQK